MKTSFLFILALALNYPLQAQPEIKRTSPTNAGTCTGSAFVEFKNGETGPYTLELDGPVTLTDESFNKRSILRDLCAGNYTLTLTDDYECTSVIEFTIAACQELTLTNPDAFLVHPSDCDTKDGRYQLALDGLFAPNRITNGAAPYSLTLINTSSGYNQKLQSGAGALVWENLEAGNYLLNIKDNKGCKGSHQFTMAATNGSSPIVLGIDKIPACNNGRPGYIQVAAIGPDNEICEFSWSDPQIPSSSGQSSLIEAQPGLNYSVTITCCDNPSCATILENLSVDQENPDEPLGIIDSVIVGNTCLNGPESGTVDILIVGGIEPYRFAWNNGANSRKLTNVLVDATYCVTVTDACGSSATLCADVPSSPYANLEVDADIENTNNRGKITLWPIGGDGEYTFHWSNGASTQNLTNLLSGTYKVTVSDGQGCQIIKSYKITNCNSGVYDETNPLTLDAIVAGGGSGAGCQGNRTLSIRKTQGGQPPYLVHIELVSSPVDPDFGDIRQYDVLPMGYPTNLNTLDFEVPAGRYFVRLFDACGNEVNQYVDLCEFCGYTYNPQRQRFLLGDRGQMEIILHCDCAFSCNGDDNYLELKYIPKGMGEMNYTITWPDNTQAFFNYNQGGNTGVSGQVRYYFDQPPAGGMIDVIVKVEREDGCSFDMPVKVNDGGLASVLFSARHNQYGGQYYTGSSVCDLCVPEPGYYQAGEAQCYNANPITAAPRVFGYLPNDLNNPCEGGGRLQAHRIVNGQVIVYTFNIPPNVNIPIESPSTDFGLTNNILEDFDCAEGKGGHCLFDAINVYGFSLDKLMLVSFCREFVNEVPDRDNDDIPDPIDNCPDFYDPTNKCGNDTEGDGGTGGDKPPGEDCYREVEVCKFGGCFKRIYCEHVNGRRELLREEETDLVIECRNVFTNGDCRQLLYYCLGNCQYYRKNGTSIAGGPFACRNSDGPPCNTINEACSPQACASEARNTSATDNTKENKTKKQSSKTTVKLYPNPILDYIDLEVSNTSQSAAYQLSIYDMIGQKLKQVAFHTTPASSSSIIRINNLKNLPPGMLIFKIDSSDDVIHIEKIVKLDLD